MCTDGTTRLLYLQILSLNMVQSAMWSHNYCYILGEHDKTTVESALQVLPTQEEFVLGGNYHWRIYCLSGVLLLWSTLVWLS